MCMDTERTEVADEPIRCWKLMRFHNAQYRVVPSGYEHLHRLVYVAACADG